jgi:hypothetical protein
LPSLVSYQLKTFSSAPKKLSLLHDLLSQILPTKHGQDRVLDNSNTRVQKILTTREEWQPKIPWATAVDPSTDISTSCRGISSCTRSTLAAAEGPFGQSSFCLSEKYKNISKSMT